MVSTFGATEFPTSAGYEPTSYCTTLANFVKDNNLDGIDLDYEDNDAMNKVNCLFYSRELVKIGWLNAQELSGKCYQKDNTY